ncbi:hypothetical protein ACQ858_08390 [Variovorax ureilyticus]|uniref:hypothetical protein n=1 Tax=Variovorax ureilyticus TaxID=1836198 RepID=UPI003D67509C
MSFFTTSQPVKQVSVEGRIIRADGTVEELGQLAFWDRNPLRRIAWRVQQLLRGRKPGRITHH